MTRSLQGVAWWWLAPNSGAPLQTRQPPVAYCLPMTRRRDYVSPMPTATWQTADDLARFDEPGKTAELVRGVLVVREPPSTSHGDRAARLTVRVGVFVAFISRDRLTGIP